MKNELDDVSVIKAALAKNPTPKWYRAGRADMQSYNANTGQAFKQLYNDEIEKETEQLAAAVVHGGNSIADSQFIQACKPDRIARILARLESLETENHGLSQDLNYATSSHAAVCEQVADYEAALNSVSAYTSPTDIDDSGWYSIGPSTMKEVLSVLSKYSGQREGGK